MTTINLKGKNMKRYSFFVDGVLKRSGTKEEIYEISNKENCLCKADFEEVDKNHFFYDIKLVEKVELNDEQNEAISFYLIYKFNFS